MNAKTKKTIAIIGLIVAGGAMLAGGAFLMKENSDKNNEISTNTVTADGVAAPGTPENDAASDAAIDNAAAVIFNSENQYGADLNNSVDSENDNNSPSDSDTASDTVEAIDTKTISFKPNSDINHVYDSGNMSLDIKSFENNDGKLKLTYELENTGSGQIHYDENSTELNTVIFSGVTTETPSVRGSSKISGNNDQDEKDKIIRPGSKATVEVTADGKKDGEYDLIILGDEDTLIIKNEVADRTQPDPEVETASETTEAAAEEETTTETEE
jgi:hypothetical protein